MMPTLSFAGWDVVVAVRVAGAVVTADETLGRVAAAARMPVDASNFLREMRVMSLQGLKVTSSTPADSRMPKIAPPPARWGISFDRSPIRALFARGRKPCREGRFR